MTRVESYIISVVFLFLAFYVPTQKYEADLKQILRGLLTEEEFPPRKHENRVAIGFGSCVDVTVEGVKLLEALQTSPPQAPIHNSYIATPTQLAETFAFFFEKGSASERYVNDSKMFHHWVEAARSLEGAMVSIGGNAPVMAHRFALEGWKVLLGASMKPDVHKKMHKSITVSQKAKASDLEDYHLILEYDGDSVWGKYVCPRANRFVIHSDYSNMMINSLDSFISAIYHFDPLLVIIGGLQMLDNFPLDLALRTGNMKKIANLLSSLPLSTKIHFEMASFTEPRLMSELVKYVVPYADSIGMNEQELADLCSFYEHGNVTIASDPFPRVASTLDKIRTLYTYIGKKAPSSNRGHRSLTRIHVHTLAYQAIYIKKHSDWQNINNAVAKASLTAYRHVCASKTVNLDQVKVIMDDSFTVSLKPGSHRMPLVDSAPVSCWGEENGRICVAPNLVCTMVHKTAGGGDNVSAAGLVLQI